MYLWGKVLKATMRLDSAAAAFRQVRLAPRLAPRMHRPTALPFIHSSPAVPGPERAALERVRPRHPPSCPLILTNTHFRYEELCEMGVDIPAHEVFHSVQNAAPPVSRHHPHSHDAPDGHPLAAPDLHDFASTTPMRRGGALTFDDAASVIHGTPLHTHAQLTNPSFSRFAHTPAATPPFQSSTAPGNTTAPATGNSFTSPFEHTHNTTLGTPAVDAMSFRRPQQPLAPRRNLVSRMDRPSHASMSFSAPDSEPSFRKPALAIPEEDPQQQSLPLSRLLTLIGDAHRHRCCFRLAECEACIRQLPRSHYNTSWVQNTLGLAYFHHHQYKASLKYFAASHKAEPSRLEGVEFYSTVMWILKMEHDLAALAQHCLAVSRMRPESWCVVGNCFSLNRECDSAIKYFQRAVQCDSSFAYAYTLAGHEHHQNDDFECAMQSFRAALKCQPRHYQAWYGIGMVFQKQERLSSAEYVASARHLLTHAVSE